MAKTAQRALKAALVRMLRGFVRHGTLHLIDAECGRHTLRGAPSEPSATLRLHDPALYGRLLWNAKLCIGEAYMDGTLTLEEGSTLADLLELFGHNQDAVRDHPAQAWLRRVNRVLRPIQQHNPLERARTNVAHHYDLSRRLYELFLDDDLQYSCAYFERDELTLEGAQQAKKRHVAAKLCLAPGQRVLDIGCGWGGLAIDLARRADVRVLGITLSSEQYHVAAERAKTEGLEDRVEFRIQDYREVEGPFDRIVSVGMFEHVGVNCYPTFFERLRDLLKPDGVAVLHSIGQRSPPGSASAWMRKYIFPGAYGPALSETLAAIEKTGLWVADLEILRLHYARTLREWYRRFQRNRAEIEQLYDERFCRMWEFYLLSAESMFQTGGEMVFQMQLARQRDAVPLTRNYLYEAEAAYRAADEGARPPR